jgi:regulator of cell morphogenesis and NO signaling
MNKIQERENFIAIDTPDGCDSKTLKNQTNVPRNERSLLQDGEMAGFPRLDILPGKRRIFQSDSLAAAQKSSWALDQVIDHTMARHQSTQKMAIRIYDLAQAVSYRPMEVPPKQVEFATALFSFLHDLLQHMKREQEILFPAISQLLQDKDRLKKGRFSSFGMIKEWTANMGKEHRAVSERLRHLRKLSNNYCIPVAGPQSYQTLCRLMQELEAGLLLLMHIENYILFPKALVEEGKGH